MFPFFFSWNKFIRKKMPRRKEILMLFKSGVQLFNFHIKKTDQQTCTSCIQEIHWTMISILEIRRIDVLVCTDTRRHTELPNKTFWFVQGCITMMHIQPLVVWTFLFIQFLINALYKPHMFYFFLKNQKWFKGLGNCTNFYREADLITSFGSDYLISG